MTHPHNAKLQQMFVIHIILRSGIAMNCTGCAMHKSPVGSEQSHLVVCNRVFSHFKSKGTTTKSLHKSKKTKQICYATDGKSSTDACIFT